MALTDDPTPVLVDLAAGRDPRIVSDAGTRWLEVDLGGRFPIHSVALRPGGGVVPPEPGDVAVAVSQDGATWIEPDLAGWSATPDALVAAIVPDERAWAPTVPSAQGAHARVAAIGAPSGSFPRRPGPGIPAVARRTAAPAQRVASDV